MKSSNSKIVVQIVFSLLTCSLFFKCTNNQRSTYQNIKEYADRVKVIDTHEHQRMAEDFGLTNIRFYHLLHGSYLMNDVISAGGKRLDFGPLDSLDLEVQAKLFNHLLDYTRATSYYSHFIKGFQKLYNFDDLYFTENNIPKLSEQIKLNYLDYPLWFDKSFQKAGFEIMFLDPFWNSLNTEVDERYYALLFHINQLVMQVSRRPSSGDQPSSLYEEAKKDGFNIKTLDDYLLFCDHLYKKMIENKAVCVKNSLAYSRSLYFEDVPYKVAINLFKKSSKNLIPAESKQLQDFMFNWIIQKSIEYDLPIQIHTGYLSGYDNWLENGKPTKLNNLFIKYPDAKFVLFHVGYPWTSELIAFGKMYPNVYLDLVWLPQISRERAILALDEMLDCVPYNKIFWGGDCTFIEESIGSLEFGKEVVAETLSKRIERGLLTEDVAFDIVQRIFRENAVEVFQLKEKLGREF